MSKPCAVCRASVCAGRLSEAALQKEDPLDRPGKRWGLSCSGWYCFGLFSGVVQRSPPGLQPGYGDGRRDETAGLQLELLDDENRLQAIDRFTELAENAYEEYNWGEIAYEEAEALIKTLSTYCTENGLPGLVQDLKVLRQSKVDFEKAVEAEKKGEDTEAFSYYNKVVEDDLQYEAAQGKVKAFCQSYKRDLLLAVEAYDAQGDYEAAASALEQSLEILNGDEEIYDLIGKYEVKAWKKQKEERGFTA